MSHSVLEGLGKSPGAAPARSDDAYLKALHELHSDLVRRVDLSSLRKLSPDELESELRRSLTEMLRQRELPLPSTERLRLVEDVINEIVGLGPIERLLHDPGVTDILINTEECVYVERNGRLERTDVRFRDRAHLMHVIDRIVSAVGRRIDESSPMVDARLSDGSRFNAIIPPLALDGPLVSIRRFGARPITRQDLIRLDSIPEPILLMLEACVKARLNILVSGGTGSGKTTLLNVLSSFIPANERIVTIEDAAELRLQQPHVCRLETRPRNLEGQGEIVARDLVRNSLRMRPDRIIVGEIRGIEVIDMLQAMNTGHEGSISTVHANSARHALGRVQTMVGLGMGNLPGPAIREMMSDALDLIVHVHRLQDGRRRLVSVTEITGMEGQVISTQEVFRFRQTTVDADGKVRGRFESTGIRPAFSARLEAHGMSVPPSMLSFSQEV
jgi:pilus assembly protein CpaF